MPNLVESNNVIADKEKNLQHSKQNLVILQLKLTIYKNKARSRTIVARTKRKL